MRARTHILGGSGGKRTSVSVLAGAILFLLIMWSPESAWPAEGRADDVAKAARIGLDHYLARAVADGAEKYGFGPGERIDQARIGEPFRLYAVAPDALAGYKTGDGVSSIVTPTETWLVPVIRDEKIKAILTVDGSGGSYRAVALGMAPLAVELNKVLKRWPRSSGYDVRLVAVFQAAAYFFTVPRLGDRNLTPFVFAGKGFGWNPEAPEADYSAPVDIQTTAEALQAVADDKLAAPAGGNGEGGAR